MGTRSKPSPDYVTRLKEHWSRYKDQPSRVVYFGEEFTVQPGVFNASEAYTSRVLIEAVDFVSPGVDVLEMGAGAGIAGILCVTRAGARSATLVDRTAAAVANSNQNVAAFGLSARCHVVQSDLFAALPAGEQYDVILFNMPCLELEISALLDGIEGHRIPPAYSFADPGYQIIRRFFGEATGHLRSGGFFLCTFGDFGNRALLDDILVQNGLVAECVHRLVDHVHVNQYQVLHIARIADRAVAVDAKNESTRAVSPTPTAT